MSYCKLYLAFQICLSYIPVSQRTVSLNKPCSCLPCDGQLLLKFKNECHENILNMISDQSNANENHSDMPFYTDWNGYNQKGQ